MRIFLLLGILLLSFGCKDDKKQSIASERPIVKLDSLSKEKVKVSLKALSSDAEKNLENFDDFQNLRKLITTMQSANPYYVHKYTDSLSLLMHTFKQNLPKDLSVNTIKSRTNILLTEKGLLSLLAEKKHPDPKKIIEANTRLIIAFNSLITQLNELSLAIPENIEKELLRDPKNKEE